jgi:membrane protein DedA with SNARE-associated domain
LKTLLKYFAVLQSLGLWGIFLIAALDGAGVPVPGAVDLIVATSVYQSPSKAWIYILLAAAGSTLGCLLLYVIGRLGGEVLVERRMSPEKFKKVQADFERHSFLTVAIPALLPPPFPFKIVVLSAGAFEMAWTHFLFAIFVGRLIRFGALSVLTIVFGPNMVMIFRSVIRRHPLESVGALLVIVAAVILVRRLRRNTASLPQPEELSN